MSVVMLVMSLVLCREGVPESKRARVGVHQLVDLTSRLHLKVVVGGSAWASHSFTATGRGEVGEGIVRGDSMTGVVVVGGV